MTTWTEQTPDETSWKQRDDVSSVCCVGYNDDLLYNADFITYNGGYVNANTDWSQENLVETTWVE